MQNLGHHLSKWCCPAISEPLHNSERSHQLEKIGYFEIQKTINVKKQLNNDKSVSNPHATDNNDPSQVCFHWPQFASKLHLVSSIPSLSVTRPDSWTDSHKLSQLLNMWRKDQPETYNVKTLLIVLRLLGLRDMEQWIQMLTSRRYCGMAVENHHTKAVVMDNLITRDKKDGYNSFHARAQNRKHSISSYHERTVSQASDYYDSVSPAVLNTSYGDYGYSDCVSPTSDKVYVHNNYSSDSGLSSTYSDMGDMLVRSCLTIDISTGIVTREKETDDDLKDRPFHSVGSCKDRSNFSFVSKKREKFAKSRTCQGKYKTELGGVFRTLFRPEGKVMSRVSDMFEEKPVVGEMKNNMKHEHNQYYLNKWKQKKDDMKHNRDTSEKIGVEKYFDNLVTILHKAVQSLES